MNINNKQQAVQILVGIIEEYIEDLRKNNKNISSVLIRTTAQNAIDFINLKMIEISDKKLDKIDKGNKDDKV